MKRMWRDKGLVLGIEYWVLRCFSGVSRNQYRVSGCLLNGNKIWGNIERELIVWKDGFNRGSKTYYSLFTIYLIGITLFLGSCNSDVKQNADNQQYTCSMHPEIVKDKPGSCPICGMDLTPIRGHHSTHSADSLLATGKNTDHRTETIIVKEDSYAPEIALSGTVTYNTNQLKSISARVSGRIEKSYVKYNFEPIKKGQLLLKIYSPELVAIQQELLFLRSKNDIDLLNQTKAKLSLLGVSTQQINNILKTGKADYTINIYSNYSGYLLSPDANNTGDLQSTNNPLNIREGQYINSGDLLFKVFNDNSLWAEFYTNTSESEWLKVGSELSVKIGSQMFNAKVSFVQPFFKNGQNYKMVRVALNNQNRQYKIGELATAMVKHSEITGIWIPEQAVYQSGEKSIVFIKTKNGLESLEVQVSAKADGHFLVQKGLIHGDEIAKNASYITDSESFINSK